MRPDVFVGLCLALMVAACTATALPAPDAAPTPSAASSPAPAATQTPTPAPTPDATPDTPPATDPTCTDPQLDAMRTSVVGQLDAIIAEDWDAALGFSTPGFRTGFGPDAFAAVITEQFPVVAAATGADVTRCVVAVERGEANLLVTVVDVDGAEQQLVYLLELHDGQWLIGGAVPTEPAEAPGEPALEV